MIKECIDVREGIRLELVYESAELRQAVIDETNAIANNMRDKEGADMYELMRATEDDAWILHRGMDRAWSEVIGVCQRYIACACPLVPDRDSITNVYSISMQFPKRWPGSSAITLEHNVREYLLSVMLYDWWVSKGNADHASLAMARKELAVKSMKYSMNARLETFMYGREGRYY